MLIEKPRIPLREVLLFGLWPSVIKILLYRVRGYRIGKHVSIGFGSVICGESVEVGSYTTIGFLTVVRGKQIRLGSHVHIGATSFLDTPYIDIGDGTKINEQVFVGGLQFPDSRFVLGRNCQIMQMSFLNPARSIVVGDDSGIGGHCLVFGHTSWLSQFEGYPVEFEPIEIGKSVSLAWGVFVLPRTRIGDGAVIGARSVVHGSVPPQCLALGFPARVVARAPEFPRHVSEEEKVEIFRRIVADMVQLFVGSGLVCQKKGEYYQFAKPRRRWWQRNGKTWTLYPVEGGSAGVSGSVPAERIDVLLSLAEISEEHRKALNSQKTVWIDIARKERASFSNDLGDEVDQFLKRYGVRTIRSESVSSEA